jgi:uroporphyrinogen-III synthase
VGQEVIETKPVYKVFPLMEGEIEKWLKMLWYKGLINAIVFTSGLAITL